MQALSEFKKPLQILFTDIDDTLTSKGQLPAQSYEMLWKLSEAGIQVVPVTGRPAGWCEMIARMWPVLAVIGENGAFSFQYKNKKMQRLFATDEKTRKKNQEKLTNIKNEILQTVAGSAVASDQFARLFDLAIDFCEDVAPLKKESIQQIVQLFESHGATAKVSSIHVNGWFGAYDKKSMCEIFYKSHFSGELKNNLDTCGFIGDSPNDEPLFEFFENSFAVANILNFKNQLNHNPKFVTPSPAAQGFVELGQRLLALAGK